MRARLVLGACAVVLSLAVAACGDGGGRSGDGESMAAVSGEVTKADPAEIPEGAVIVVRVFEDVEQPTSSAVIGQQEIVTGGEQAPIAFEVAYPANAVDPGRAYRASADVTVDGVLRYLSVEAIPVITEGAPASGVQIALEPVT